MSKASFLTTNWNTIALTAGTDALSSQEALEKVCAQYWYPLYAYARRIGCDVPTAEDVTQGFLLHVCQSGLLSKADQNLGRFRSFLLTSFENYLHGERKRAQAIKRGGGALRISFDEVDAEARYALEPRDNRTPERLFERSWAIHLLDEALRRLQQEFDSVGRGELFKELQPVLVKQSDAAKYREISSRLEISEGLAKVWVCRMRKRLRGILTELVSVTAQDQTEVDAELRHLLELLTEP